MGSEMIWTYALLVEDSRWADEQHKAYDILAQVFIQRWLTPDSEDDHGVPGSWPLAGIGDTRSSQGQLDAVFTWGGQGRVLPPPKLGRNGIFPMTAGSTAPG
jgi:hypothetical protein